jgi:hypothetical protein
LVSLAVKKKKKKKKKYIKPNFKKLKKKDSYTPFIINASIEWPSNCIYGFLQLISGQRLTSRKPQLPTDRIAIFENTKHSLRIQQTVLSSI